MKQYKIIIIMFVSYGLISACASTGRLYFKQTSPKKPHAVLKFEMGEKVGFLFDVRIAKVIPSSINGMPINTREQDWKAHAYGEFLIPPGDTMVFLSCHGRDVGANGYVRFDAQEREIYKITYAIKQDTVIFRVMSSKQKIITAMPFKVPKYTYSAPKYKLAHALFEAAAEGNIEEVKSLLEQGAYPDWRGPRGFTPLIIAASRGHRDIVKLLIEAGANPNVATEWTALTFSSDRGYKAIVQLLIEAGAYIDFRMPGGYSALMAAADQGHVDIVELLLRRGAYTNTRNRKGRTALDLANLAGNQEIADMIEKAVKIRDKKGNFN